jgi:hypothetical protein
MLAMSHTPPQKTTAFQNYSAHFNSPSGLPGSSPRIVAPWSSEKLT